MKNNLTDLKNHLFLQLERLNNEELTSEQIPQEVERAKAISVISSQIVSANRLILEAIEVSSNISLNDEVANKNIQNMIQNK